MEGFSKGVSWLLINPQIYVMNKRMCEWRVELREQGRSRHVVALRTMKNFEDLSTISAGQWRLFSDGSTRLSDGTAASVDTGDGPLYLSSKRDLYSSCVGLEKKKKNADSSNFVDRSLACDKPVGSHFHIISTAALHECSSNYIHHTTNLHKTT